MIATHPFKHAQTMFHAALEACDPATAVSQALKLKSNSPHLGKQTTNSRLFLASIGKASIPMAQAAIKSLGKALYKGSIISKEGTALPQLPKNVTISLASHPIVSEKSIAATANIKALLHETTSHDHIICLLSGGASALLSKPRISLSLWQKLNKALLQSGCTIQEFNTVRRQLDAVKNGGLARWAAPATCHTLILSDVIGNNLEAIGSGPTFFSNESPNAALKIFEKYDLISRFSESEWGQIQDGLAYDFQKGLQPPPTYHIIGDVKKAAEASLDCAKELGYKAQILTTQFEGEAAELGKFAAAIGKDAKPNHCFILGGESTVTIRGSGIGGRNSELALSAAIALNGRKNITIASLATDGDDGATEMAGFVVNGETIKNGLEYDLDPNKFLTNNDSGTYFSQLENLSGILCRLNTGLTGTNVNDLIYIFRNEA